MKALAYIGAALGGVVVGAALGVLLAPEKGKDTRSKIVDKSNKIVDAITNYCEAHNIKLTRKQACEIADEVTEEA